MFPYGPPKTKKNGWLIAVQEWAGRWLVPYYLVGVQFAVLVAESTLNGLILTLKPWWF